MNGLKWLLLPALLIWIAGGLNMGLSDKVAIFGANPDFLLVVMGTLTLFLGRSGGALLGFVCGVFYGSLAGANLAQHCISRTIAGFSAGWLTELGFQANLLMAFLGTIFLTLVARLLVMFSVGPDPIMPFLWDTLGMAIYNGVLAMPFYVLVRRLFETQSK